MTLRANQPDDGFMQRTLRESSYLASHDVCSIGALSVFLQSGYLHVYMDVSKDARVEDLRECKREDSAELAEEPTGHVQRKSD